MCSVPCDRVICGLTLWLTFTLCLHYELFKNFRDNSNSVAGQWQQSIWRDCPGQSGTSEGYEREWKMDSIIHTLICYSISSYTQYCHAHTIIILQVTRLAEMGQGPPNFYTDTCYTTHSYCTQVSCPTWPGFEAG